MRGTCGCYDQKQPGSFGVNEDVAGDRIFQAVAFIMGP